MTDFLRFLDPISPRYGALLNWQNNADPFWHYGIGLSDTHIYDTGGLIAFERSSANVVIGVDQLLYPPQKVIDRLGVCIQLFSSWNYNVIGWNCEHFARLVATGVARCYQVKPLWLVGNLTSEGDHKEAAHLLNQYLARHWPSLLAR